MSRQLNGLEFFWVLLLRIWGGGKLENTDSISLFSKYWLPSRNSAM